MKYHFSNVSDKTLNDFLALNMPTGMLEHTQNSLRDGTLSIGLYSCFACMQIA